MAEELKNGFDHGCGGLIDVREWREVGACLNTMSGSDLFNLQPLAVILFLPSGAEQAVLDTIRFVFKSLELPAIYTTPTVVLPR
jgi:hypothetical protein